MGGGTNITSHKNPDKRHDVQLILFYKFCI